MQTDPATAHPRLGPVLLWENQGVFPGGSGGASGEAESREAACGRCDHSEPGQRMAGEDPIRPVPLGSRHHSEILQGGTGQTVRTEGDVSVDVADVSVAS